MKPSGTNFYVSRLNLLPGFTSKKCDKTVLKMKRYFSFFLILLLAIGSVQAVKLDDIRRALEQSAVTQVQEKVYLHTDNQCYFVGDTLWYKAYVVRADNLQPTDMSRILYVELLTPDGLLVERQNIIVASGNYTCGQFVLQDSLYSGYYELRAYTRWMLNFGVSQHAYTTPESWNFYNRQMAADYYRVWDGLYSRVLPIYSKPATPGDYDARRMYQRPKQRLQKPKKDALTVTFYPEGGHLVEGLTSQVAFEVQDQLGEGVNLSGTLMQGSQQVATIASTHLGRGVFTITPGDKRLEASFTWHGKQYSFKLPKAEPSGAVITLTGHAAMLQMRGLPQGGQYAVSILCRGVLRHFAPVNAVDGQAASIPLPLDSLPAGVNDLTLFDSDGHILADRLFFVQPRNVTAITSVGAVNPTTTYAPYAPITVSLQAPAPNVTFSLSVTDTSTDEPTYNDGNLMTDLLLSSELRGFIARPAYYFERDDAEHRQRLDLLMMVQGWRKYPWQELSDTTRQLRYEPERTMTVSGAVYRQLGIAEVQLEEVLGWQNGVGRVSDKFSDPTAVAEETATDDGLISTEDTGTDVTAELSTIETGNLGNANDELGVNHGGLKREVLVEAEVVMDGEIVAGRQMTHDGGRFLFQIPPFYGATYLNLKAYKERDSLKKAMTSRKDATIFKEEAYADYYVKRDMPYPIFTRKYSYYENHAPEWEVAIDEDSLSELSMENDVHQLQNVNVKGHRRGKRAIDWSKPAYVRDAYDVYNDLTDYGLSFGYFDRRLFPLQVAKFLFGNMGRQYRQFNVDGRLEGQTYWRNYSPLQTVVPLNNRAPEHILSRLKLARLQNVRVFSDYEPRNEDSTLVESLHLADATVDMQNIADDGTQVVYRDRHIFLHGFAEPAAFYHPNYANRELNGTPADNRRTLYWNPNARSDADGRFSATFYNNAKDTRIKISAAGVTPDGSLMYYK